MGDYDSPEAAAGKWLQEYENNADLAKAIKSAWAVYRATDTSDRARQAALIALDELIKQL